MTTEEARDWLLETLKGETGGPPLDDEEVRAIPATEVVSHHFTPIARDNRLILRNRFPWAAVEFVLTVHKNCPSGSSEARGNADE